MKFVKYEMSAGYCGTDQTIYAKFDDDTTDEEIGDIGEQLAWDHADSYGAVEEWERDNPEVEFELDYSWNYIKEEEKPSEYNWEDYTKHS